LKNKLSGFGATMSRKVDFLLQAPLDALQVQEDQVRLLEIRASRRTVQCRTHAVLLLLGS
jgi:hypothetical protein